MARRRFGVSLSEDLAEGLDRLAERLGCDRSSIVEEALREYLHDHLHYLRPHRCTGVLLVVRPRGHGGSGDFVDRYQDVVKLYSHLHVDDKCVETLVVSGPSGSIACLVEELERRGWRTRYIPLSYSVEDGGDGGGGDGC